MSSSPIAPRAGELAVDVPGARLAGTLVAPSTGVEDLLVLRTPYDRTAHLAEAHAWARRGIAMYVQDVRGRYGSTGAWEPYRHEAADGRATLDALLAAFPDARIALTGGSYAAGCARAAATHPAVRALLSAVPAIGLRQTIFGPEDALHLQRHAWWWSTHGCGPRSRPDAFSRALARHAELLDHSAPDVIERLLEAPGWAAAIRDANRAYGTAPALPEGMPTLSLGGWWDPFVAQIWSDGAAPDTAAGVTIGPWAHDLDGRAAVGELPPAPGAAVSIGALQHRWLRSALAGTPEPLDAAWIGEGWVPTAAATETLTLHFSTSGSLVLRPDPEAAPLRWDHHPAHGLPGRCWPVDVAADDAHPDCLRLTRRVSSRVQLLGRARLRLRVLSTGPESGPVLARLAVRRADGMVLPLTYAFSTGVDAAAGVARLELLTRPFGATLDPGTELVLDLAGGAHPLHPRHPHPVARQLDPTGCRVQLPTTTARPFPVHPWQGDHL